MRNILLAYYSFISKMSQSHALEGVVLVSLWAFCATGNLSHAQSSGSSGTIRGSVIDPAGAVIVGASVGIQNPVTHYDRTAQTDSKGNFAFPNVPYKNYHVITNAPGFQTLEQDVDVRSAVPVELKLSLAIHAASTAVTVTAEGKNLIELQPVTHTDVDRGLFDKLPLESQSSSLSSLITLSTPGISADSNGFFHGLGDHGSNSFSVDGQPITDQQSKLFSNQLPSDAVQSMEVIEGAPPAEFGGKTSVVIVATTRSGLGITTPHGEVTASYGSFGTTNEGFNLAYGGSSWGNFISANGLNTGRFLDTPEYAVMHDKGNEENFFDRLDFRTSDANSFNVNFQFTRSWFQTPNSFDAQDATAWSGLVVNNGGIGPNGLPVGPSDQRSQIKTFNIAPAWTRLLNPHTVFTFGGFVRADRYNYYPSNDPFADLQPDLLLQTTGMNRKLTNAGLRSSLSYVNGVHNLKAGATYEHTLLTENDNIGIVDPTLNAPCNNADGSPYTAPNLTNPGNCGALQQNPNFVPLLGCYDLTRTAPLPPSDGCSTTASAPYLFHGHADIKEMALYIQDTITKNNWSFNLGLRGDFYSGITNAKEAEPRAGVAYNIKPSNTVLRVSYAHTMETPFNENLVLSSEGCSNPVVNAIMSSTVFPCVSKVPLSPGARNEFHAGLEQAFGRYLVVDGEYIWKYTQRAFDFSQLGDSPLTFPIEWTKSKIPGYAIRATVPNFHGLTAFVVVSGVSARFWEPQVSGIGAAQTCPPSTGCEVFRIDHDEKINGTTHLQYQFWRTGPWVSFNWRYDGGSVAGPAPCAGGNCSNGPNGTDSIVDVSNLSPDQQFQAGLFCGSVKATPTTPISPNNLCPASQYGSTLINIPAAGAENDDHNPPRVATRNLFDLAVGHDNIFHGDKYKWSARLTVLNLTNKEALYNFLSFCSGTHYVTPRAITATIGFHF
jgi:hypothetical protein